MLRAIIFILLLGPFLGWLLENWLNEREYQRELQEWRLRRLERMVLDHD